MDLSKVFIVIPAKDEGRRIGSVLGHIRELGYGNIVVVDDGSEDDTQQVAERYNATVLKHLLNMGAGAATQTGIQYALQQGAEIIVTLDGDHQHLPSDIALLVNTLLEKDVDVVIGSRFLGNNPNIPWIRILYNKIGNVITLLFAGLMVTDSQSGMKALRAGFARKSVIQRNGFEFCMEIIKNMRIHKASWCEVPISVNYTRETMAKGQNFWSGVNMVFRLWKVI